MPERERRPVGRPPSDSNARGAVLAAAIELIVAHGYAATSIRDISAKAGVQSSSLYHYFPSKDAMMAAVADQAARDIVERVEAATTSSDPWLRLTQACAAHLELLLLDTGAVRVLASERPDQHHGVARDALVAARRSYEHLLDDLIDDLPLRDGVDRRRFRFALLGALNWTPVWFDAAGTDSPAVIAERTVAMFRDGVRGH